MQSFLKYVILNFSQNEFYKQKSTEGARALCRRELSVSVAFRAKL